MGPESFVPEKDDPVLEISGLGKAEQDLLGTGLRATILNRRRRWRAELPGRLPVEILGNGAATLTDS
jgi:hypothetical protein